MSPAASKRWVLKEKHRSGGRNPGWWKGKGTQWGTSGQERTSNGAQKANGRGTTVTLFDDSVSPAVKQHHLPACGITRLKSDSAHTGRSL